MLKMVKRDPVSDDSLITADESKKIDQKIAFELHQVQCKLIELAGFTNIAMGLFITWIFFHQIKPLFLFSWYIALFLANATNMIVAFYYLSHKPELSEIKARFMVCHTIMGVIAFIWGLIGISVVYFPIDFQYQLFAVAFLLTALVAFSLGTATDFIASAICIGALLLPPIIFYTYLLLGNNKGHSSNLNFAFDITFINIGIFVLITSYVACKLVKKSFELTFINVELSKKLKHANKFLEQRVKQRTLELEKSFEVVEYQATHDLLTHLPNQRLLVRHIELAIASANENNSMFAIFFFGLNEMDKINDGLGHTASALVVQTIAKRLKRMFNQIKKNSKSFKYQYTISLSRRDEFVILLQSIYALEALEELGSTFFSLLEEPVYLDGHVVKLTASIGVSIYPRDGEDVKSLLMNADAAMMVAKHWGGNKLNIYQSEINAGISKQLKIEAHLHDALKNNEFRVYYQPFVNLKLGQVCGMEALLRWKNPELGFVSPLDFIVLAEAGGVIIPLGEWVFRQACLQTKIWHEQGFKSLKVAINLSAKQLQYKNLLKSIDDILKETALAPEYIELELTETEAFKEEAIPIIKQLKAMGLGLSIDDFGTGYSGLKNLKLFAIDKLKIDKSFIQDIDVSEDSKTIVRNTITLAKKMGITVLAEGVETKQQLDFLLKSDCDMVQGYYFSPALRADDFMEFLISKRILI